MTIIDITGESIEVTNLDAAIEQCKMCADSPYKMASGHTVGENHRFMLEQLEKIRRKERRLKLSPATALKIENSIPLTNIEMGHEMEQYQPFAPARHPWEKMEREDLLIAFNAFFQTDIQ